MANDPSSRLDAVFHAFADPTRRGILERLARGEASGMELAQPFPISLPAISKHLRVLERASLIVRRKEGRVHRFRLNGPAMREAARWLEQYRQFWGSQLDGLAAYLAAVPDQGGEDADGGGI
jgi:DNA-binding transcriptional ArsR family regulator